MKNAAFRRMVLIAGCTLGFAACSSPVTPLADPPATIPPSTPPTIYNRVIIDTYPAATGLSANTDTYLSLYGSQGTLAAPIAVADAGNLTYSVGYARIDYSGGLSSGTYYVQAKGGTLSAAGPYALRVLTALGAYPNEYSPGDFFAVLNNSDSPYETDDVVVNGLPVTPVSAAIGSDYNRYLTLGGGDSDWFTFTLP